MTDYERDLAAGGKPVQAPGGAAPDRVAPGGLAGVVKGQHAPSQQARGTGESAARGAMQGASLGFGDEISAAVDAGISHIPGVRSFAGWVDRKTGGGGAGLPVDDPNITYQQRRDAYRTANAEAQQQNPKAYFAGEFGGSLATGIAPTSGAGLARQALTYGAQGALAGAGHSEGETGFDMIKDAAGGGVTSAVIGPAVGRLIQGAPKRVDERLVKNLSRGEEGGAARDSLYRDMIRKAGGEFEGLNEAMARSPGLKETLATTASANPAKAAKAAGGATSQMNRQLDDIYKAIDKGPAVPTSDGVQHSLSLLRAELKDAGNTGMADVVERFQGHIASHYADGQKITASQLRALKGELGEIAFGGGEAARSKFGKQAQGKIYGALNSVIENAAEGTPGVDAKALRALNRDDSVMISVKKVLEDRADKAKSGRTSLFQNLLGAGALSGATMAASGSTSASLAAPVAAWVAVKTVNGVNQAARIADFQLAKLVSAAQAGSTPAQLAKLALDVGISRSAADEISERGIDAIQPVNPVLRAREEQRRQNEQRAASLGGR